MALVCNVLVYRSITAGAVLIKRSRGQRTRSNNITVWQQLLQFVSALLMAAKMKMSSKYNKNNGAVSVRNDSTTILSAFMLMCCAQYL